MRAAPSAWTASKVWRPRSAQDADKVHHRVGIGNGGRDGGVVADIGLDGHDLADIADGLEEACKVRAAHGNAYPPAAARKILHQVAPDETGAAEDGDELAVIAFHGDWPFVEARHPRLCRRAPERNARVRAGGSGTVCR